MLSKVFTFSLLCPQNWNIEQEEDGEKEKVVGRPAKLNDKKGDRGLEREIKKQMRHFFVGRTAGKFCSGKFFAEIYRLNTHVVENLFEEKVLPAVLV